MSEIRNATIKKYITAIYELGGQKETVRTSDAAKTLGHGPSSATETFQRMSQEGLVEYTPYVGVRLTKNGLGVAKKVIARRKTLRRLLLCVGVPPEVAESECKDIELVIADRTVEYIHDFLKKGGLK